MSKQRRQSDLPATASPATEPARSHDPDLAEALSHGNQAASERVRSSTGAAQALADHAAVALRIAPRDPAWTARLVDIIDRSHLPADRRELVALRLRSDQATADEVGAVVRAWLGADTDAIRSSLVTAFDRVAQDPTVADAEHQVAVDTGHPIDAVRGLCRDLVLLVAFVWDDEEEQAPPGDYLAEESGT